MVEVDVVPAVAAVACVAVELVVFAVLGELVSGLIADGRRIMPAPGALSKPSVVFFLSSGNLDVRKRSPKFARPITCFVVPNDGEQGMASRRDTRCILSTLTSSRRWA